MEPQVALRAIKQKLKAVPQKGSRLVRSALSKVKPEQAPLFSSVQEALDYKDGDLFRLSPEDVLPMYAMENNISLQRAMEVLSKEEQEFIKLAGEKRQDLSNSTPPVMVIDNFYDDPDAIRQFALSQKYIKYNNFGWFTTELWPLMLKEWPLSREWILDRFESALGYPLHREFPYFDLCSWQGSLHYKVDTNANARACVIHSHVTDSFMGFNAVIGLNPQGNAETTLWKNTKTGKCVAISRPLDTRSEVDHELCLKIPLAYNRCILFRNDVYHRGELGWGSTVNDARLFQTFLGLDPQVDDEKTAASQEAVYKDNFNWWLTHSENQGCDVDEAKRIREIAASAGILSVAPPAREPVT